MTFPAARAAVYLDNFIEIAGKILVYTPPTTITI